MLTYNSRLETLLTMYRVSGIHNLTDVESQKWCCSAATNDGLTLTSPSHTIYIFFNSDDTVAYNTYHILFEELS